MLPSLTDKTTTSYSTLKQSRLKQPHELLKSLKPSSSKEIKLPMLIKLPCNQEEQNEVDQTNSNLTSMSSSRSLLTSAHKKDKHRVFIQELEEKKRKEKEKIKREERCKKKRHERITRTLLEKAKSREKQIVTCNEVDGPSIESISSNEPQEDDEEERKLKARRQKRLLKKQQAFLVQIQAKQQQELKTQELERKRLQRTLKKVTQTVLHKMKDNDQVYKEYHAFEDVGHVISLIIEAAFERIKSMKPNEEKQKAKEQRIALHRKHQQHLQKLIDQRKQKEKEVEDVRLLNEKRKQKIQKEAQQRLQEAAETLAQLRAKEEAEAAVVESLNEVKPSIDVDAMVARLSKLKDRDTEIIPEARDFLSWKKRHGVALDQKVFSITGWYPVIREELEKRGWFYNPDRTSPYFDLKWTLKSDDLRTGKLEKHQYVNHFAQNAAITTKVGLILNLRNAIWHQSVDIDEMFPRAYDLNDGNDMEKFIQDFRYGVAERLLKIIARQGIEEKSPNFDKERMIVNEAVLDVILDIARKKIKSKCPESQTVQKVDELEESVDNPLSIGFDILVTDLQWEVLSTCSLNEVGHLRASLVYKKKVFEEENSFDSKLKISTIRSNEEKKLKRFVEKLHIDAFNQEKARLENLLPRVSPVSIETFDQIFQILQELEKLCPQFHLNGGTEFLHSVSHSLTTTNMSENAWIVKPAGMSRGRGIRVFNDLNHLFEYVDVENHKECQWIAQKYIENPLLIFKRKFDIRQWVLVTEWDPLTIWCHIDSYLRFSSEEYSMDDLTDQYVHLTNNSIQKYSQNFHHVYATDDGKMQVEGNMWHSDDFKQFLSLKMGKPTIWDAQIHPRMKEIIVQSLQCVQDLVQHRSNTCELYGYDFMLDANLNPWLIEVNSSPACDYSTSTAQRYVESGLAGIIQVVVDYRDFEVKKRNGTNGSLNEPETGCWQRIHKADYVGKPTSSFGHDFQIKGSKMQRSRRKKKMDDTHDVRRTVSTTCVISENSPNVDSCTEVESRTVQMHDDTGIDPLL
ncbi:putative tubulin-tyrosine ligase/Tubulin polyglutamylase [Plasmopara halstedii]